MKSNFFDRQNTAKKRPLLKIIGKKLKPMLASFMELLANAENEIEDIRQYIYHMKADYCKIYDIFKIACHDKLQFEQGITNQPKLSISEATLNSTKLGFRKLGLSETEAFYFFGRFDKSKKGWISFKDFMMELQPSMM